MSYKRKRVWNAAGVAVVALLAACAAPLQPPPVQVRAAPEELAREAAAALAAGGEDAPILELRESVSGGIESLERDGTVGAYKISYALMFRLDKGEQRKIALEQVVPASESRYLASRRVREDAVSRLRRDALRQMRYILARQKN